MKREWILWSGGACAFVATVFVVILLRDGFRSGTTFVQEVESLRSMHTDPPPTFAIRWETRDRMEAERLNPQRPEESVRELAERTIADVQEIQKMLPIAEDK